jgi:hypothetical protein
MRRATSWLGLAGALIAVEAACASSTRDFSFRRAEFVAEPAALDAAGAFVATQLPAGLPLSEAVARVERAEMRCGAPDRRTGRITCDYRMLVYTDAGNLGEDVWTVQLAPRPNRTLASAVVSHVVIGSWPPHIGPVGLWRSR